MAGNYRWARKRALKSSARAGHAAALAVISARRNGLKSSVRRDARITFARRLNSSTAAVTSRGVKRMSAPAFLFSAIFASLDAVAETVSERYARGI